MTAFFRGMAGALVCFGCSVGTGTIRGQLVTPAGQSSPLTFSWRSDVGDAHQGTMDVVLPNGTRYSGPYRQVIRHYPMELYAPLWARWQPYWYDWRPPWYTSSWIPDRDAWLTAYEGRVLAGLTASNSDLMRCRFKLDDARRGMSGGGHGECQLSNGSLVSDAEILPH